MGNDGILRLRCPNDGEDGDPYGHLGAAIRLPMKADGLGEILAALGDCPCGAKLIALTEDANG